MKHTGKIVAMLLLVLMLSATVLTACGGGGSSSVTTTTPAAGGTTAPAGTTTSGTTINTALQGTSVDYNAADPLPNYTIGTESNPAKFTIFTWQSEKWNTETVTTGDVIDMTLYEHLVFIEDRLNLKIQFIKQNDSWNERKTFVEKLEQQLNSTIIPDLVASYASTGVDMQMKGLTINLLTLQNLNGFANPWWNADLIANSKVVDARLNDQLNFITGEASTATLDRIQCLMMNLDKIEELGLMAKVGNYDDPYEMVNTGTWTWDNFITMTRDVHVDDGDSTVGPSDSFGFTVRQWVDFDQMPMSIGMKSMTANRSVDTPYSIFVQYKSSTMTEFVATMLDFVHQSEGVWNDDSGTCYFADGNICFSSGDLSIIRNQVRNQSFTYGVLPYPMLNSDQDKYYSSMGMYFTMFSIPKLAADAEVSAAVLELLGWNGFRTVSKVIFEECFKTKFDLTGNDWRIYDILRSNLQWCPGRLLSIRPCLALFRDTIAKQGDWASNLQTYENNAKTELATRLSGGDTAGA